MESLFQKINRLIAGPEIAIFHHFHKPPYGGGNQFLLALEKELKSRGHNVGRNRVGRATKVALFNSFNFDFKKLLKLKKKYPHIKMVHRVDGPISTYRGDEKTDTDTKIWLMNRELADATIFQSEYSRDKHLGMGLTFKDASVIHNAADPAIFNREGRLAPPDGIGKLKLIATAWSNNPKKGSATLMWLDQHLNPARHELTFVGHTQAKLKRAKVMRPLPSKELSQILKRHDIYIAPSQDDPCSNALIEALSCGLPAVYLRSGGHPELVKGGGESFANNDEILVAVRKVASNYRAYQEKIDVPSLREVADGYLKVFGL